MPFTNENVSEGLLKDSSFQTGRNNFDPNSIYEKDVFLPWPSNPEASYIYYDCVVEIVLDSGIVIHNRLPQVDKTADTLASTFLDASDLHSITDKGVNLKSNDKYTDIMQRMAHSRYWFNIRGQALRIGYKVPIPGIKTIGGVPAIPHDLNPQRAFNAICPGGNYGGVVLWRAQWSLWYTTLVQPTSQTYPSADPTTLIRGTPVPPTNIQAPFSQYDDNAVTKDPKIENEEPVGFVVEGKQIKVNGNQVIIQSKPTK